MADQYFKDTSRTTDSIEATGSMASSASPPGLANKSLSSDTSATTMAKFSLDLRDLEAAAALETLGMVPETQWPVTEASTLEMSTDSEVTFRKVLGSAEVLATRPGVDPLEVTRPLADVSWTSQSPQATSPSVITRQPTRTSPGPWPPVASHVFGPSTTQVEPDTVSRQTTFSHHMDDPGSFHIYTKRFVSTFLKFLCSIGKITVLVYWNLEAKLVQLRHMHTDGSYVIMRPCLLAMAYNIHCVYTSGNRRRISNIERR